MNRIMQERQSTHTISLSQGGSMIEEYHQLDFSDQIQVQGSSQDYRGDLSVEKLKYLGVDKFPENYRPTQTFKDVSETRYYSKNTQNDNGVNNQKLQNFLYSRKKNRKNNSQSFQQQKCFNIDSFLNSQPVKQKNYQSSQYQYKNADRSLNNRNALQQILKQKQTGRQSKRNERLSSDYYQNKKRLIEEQNRKIRQFIKQNQQKYDSFYANREYQKQPNQYYQQSQKSITLITLPVPQQIQIHPSKKIPKYNQKSRKHNKNHSLTHYGSSAVVQDQQTREEIMKLRFQQAKINFLDNFLPQTMKIGNNPYNFWKYANAKRSNFLKIL